jgi:hypothetical protein
VGHLWRAESAGSFERIGVPEVGLSLVPSSEGLDLLEGTDDAALAKLMPFERQTVLLVGAGARVLVNGEPALAVAVLEERDELLVGGESLLFGSVRATAPRALVVEDGAQRCGRCHRVLHPGDVVIECGNCAGLHHEGLPSGGEEALLCWSHAPACGMCQHDRGGWTPEETEDA